MHTITAEKRMCRNSNRSFGTAALMRSYVGGRIGCCIPVIQAIWQGGGRSIELATFTGASNPSPLAYGKLD